MQAHVQNIRMPLGNAAARRHLARLPEQRISVDHDAGNCLFRCSWKRDDPEVIELRVKLRAVSHPWSFEDGRPRFSSDW